MRFVGISPEAVESLAKYAMEQMTDVSLNGPFFEKNLSSGFPTKRDSNQPAQLQKLARKLKFRS